MSETKYELPPAMVKAAKAAIDKRREIIGAGMMPSVEFATIALEAAGVADLFADFQSIFDALDLGDCPADAFKEMEHGERVTAICQSIREQRRFLVHWKEQADLHFQQAKTAQARIAELEVSLADAFDWIGHLPKSADSASAVSVNDWIHQAAALLEKAQASAGGE